MKKEVQTTKSGYPLMRYLSLLLVVALLFSGVTFARFALERRGSIDTGVALFDASYTVEGVNSLTFGNQSYWQKLAGAWYAQGGSRTVRIGMKNNSDVDVRANVLHMEGPAEFWENIALQLTTVEEEIESETGYAAGEVVTTQYVLADFLLERDSTSEEEHNFTYKGYIDWDKQKNLNDASDGVFNTGFSDEFGQRGNVEESLQMSGSIVDKDGTLSGTVTAVRQGTSASATDFTEMPLTITITASMKEVQYSVGFARRQEQRSLPAFYLDCVKTVLYYTIDITLPDDSAESGNQGDPYFVLDAKNGSDSGETDSLLVFLTWTNALGSSDLKTDVARTPAELEEIATGGSGEQVGTYNGATVIGYHFNYNDVPAMQNGQPIETTVRMNKTVMGRNESGTTERNESGTWNKLDPPTIAWEHIASINSGEGAYPHPLIAQTDGSYVCTGDPSVTIAAGVLGIGKYDGSFSSSEFETTTVENKTVCVAAEKGYAVRFGVDFVQYSELPEETGA